jgi:hypothetical protein
MAKILRIPTLPAIPGPARAIIRPMLFAALGLHALLLFVPFPQEKQKPPENKEAPVKITQLPTTKSIPKTKITPKIPVANPNKPSPPKINRPTANPVVVKPEKPVDTPRPPEAPPQKGDVANPANESATPFAEFPHYSPSTPNCFDKGLGENCRVATASLSQVASFYQTTPKTKGFKVDVIENGDSTKVYSVTSKNGKTLYLTLFADAPTTVILLSPEKVTDLASLKGAITLPEEYVSLIGDLANQVGRGDGEGTTASPDKFAQPTMFYQVVSSAELMQGMIPDMRPGIDGSPILAAGQNPDAFYQLMMTSGLSALDVKPHGQYGGGKLYQIRKDSTTFFMNLVPTKDNSGTIVVTWLKDPTK